MARKRKAKPTGRRRAERQQVKDRLAHAQDDAQRLGIIPTTPEEALKSARVDPARQGEQLILDLPLRAAREDWGTDGATKGRLVQEIVDVVMNPETPGIVKVMGTNTLGKLDQMQWERDHPEEAGKAKGGGVNVGVSVDTGGLIRQVLAGVQAQKQAGKELEDGEGQGEQGSEGARQEGQGVGELGGQPDPDGPDELRGAGEPADQREAGAGDA